MAVDMAAARAAVMGARVEEVTGMEVMVEAPGVMEAPVLEVLGARVDMEAGPVADMVADMGEGTTKRY